LEVREMSDAKNGEVLLRVRDLKKHFTPHQGLLQALGKTKRLIKAVDGISFDIKRGEIFALIGESGSGKTTTGKLVMKLIDPSAGTIEFDGQDATVLDKPALEAYRRKVEMI
jgi:peptide/nickel transport system ATP-binding protein